MSEIDANTRLARSTSPLVSEIDGEVVMLEPSTSRYFGLDGTGARIWALLDEPRTVGEIVTQLTAEFEVDDATCMNEVVTFAGELSGAGLIVVEPAG